MTVSILTTIAAVTGLTTTGLTAAALSTSPANMSPLRMVAWAAIRPPWVCSKNKGHYNVHIYSFDLSIYFGGHVFPDPSALLLTERSKVSRTRSSHIHYGGALMIQKYSLYCIITHRDLSL